MIRWLVGRSRSMESANAAGRGQRRPDRRIGQFELLESRELLSSLGHPRILNGDEVDDRPGGIVNGIPTSAFATVGKVGDRFSLYCTGTLVAERYVLTAGHCVDDMNATSGRFVLQNTTYNSSRIFLHPNFDESRIGVDDSANDLAVMELSVSITTVTPSPIFRGVPEVGDVLTLVGFGAAGTGESGHDGSYGTKRMGTTPIDRISARRIHWTFDNNTESNTGPGDSGGPGYLSVNGTFHIAGVTSGGDRANAGLGDNSYDTRVDAYASWIDSIIGVAAPGPDPAEDDHADVIGADATMTSLAEDGSFASFGSIESAGDRDVFQIEVGAFGALTVELASSGGRLDTFLRLYDSQGNLRAQDDDSGPGTDSRLSVSLEPGLYYVSAAAFNDRGIGAYSLSGQLHADDHADTLVGSSPIALAGNVSTASGAIGHSGDRDTFRFVASSNGTLSIQLVTPSSSLDSVVTVYDHRGKQLAYNDDNGSGTDSQVFVKLRAGRTYYVQAAGFRDSQGAYDVVLSAVSNSRRRNRTESESGSIARSAVTEPSGGLFIAAADQRNSRETQDSSSDEIERRRSRRAEWRAATKLHTVALDRLLADSPSAHAAALAGAWVG